MAASSDNYQIGKGVISVRAWTKLPTAWAPTTAYLQGDFVRNGTSRNLYKCITAGTSAGSGGPTTTSADITDGTAHWQYIEWVDVGNCPKLEWSAELATEEHFSSRSGIRTRDKKVITEQKGKLTMTLEEITTENLVFALLGENVAGEVEIFASTQLYVELKFEGANEVGPVVNAFWGNVTLVPGGAMPFIGDSWTQFELTGEVNLDGTGAFGFVEIQ